MSSRAKRRRRTHGVRSEESPVAPSRPAAPRRSARIALSTSSVSYRENSDASEEETESKRGGDVVYADVVVPPEATIRDNVSVLEPPSYFGESEDSDSGPDPVAEEDEEVALGTEDPVDGEAEEEVPDEAGRLAANYDDLHGSSSEDEVSDTSTSSVGRPIVGQRVGTSNTRGGGVDRVNLPEPSNVHKFTSTTTAKCSVDGDSVYGGTMKFSDLVKGLGNSIIYLMMTLLTKTFSTNSSRFGLVNQMENHPFVANGVHVKKLGLEKLPNITLATGVVDGLHSKSFYLHLHFLGVDRVRPTSYFTDQELMCLTTLINLARERTLNMMRVSRQGSTAIQHVESCGPFECNTGKEMKSGKTSSRLQFNFRNFLTFASNFDTLLAKYGDTDETSDEAFKRYFGNPRYHGSAPVHLGGRDPILPKMREFVTQLSKSVFFSFSLAGCKQLFQEDPELEVVRTFSTAGEFNSVVKELKNKAVRKLRNMMFVDPEGGEEGTYLRRQNVKFPYYVDIGVEITPPEDSELSFLLLGKKTQFHARRMIREVNDPNTGGRNYRGGAGEVEQQGDALLLQGNPHMMNGDHEVSQNDLAIMSNEYNAEDHTTVFATEEAYNEAQQTQYNTDTRGAPNQEDTSEEPSKYISYC